MKAKSLGENISTANLLSVELLITDARTAHTLLDLAETTSIAESRSRRIREAHQAYESILHFLAERKPTAEQRQILGEEMKTLRERLRTAGVPVS